MIVLTNSVLTYISRVQLSDPNDKSLLCRPESYRSNLQDFWVICLARSFTLKTPVVLPSPIKPSSSPIDTYTPRHLLVFQVLTTKTCWFFWFQALSLLATSIVSVFSQSSAGFSLKSDSFSINSQCCVSWVYELWFFMWLLLSFCCVEIEPCACLSILFCSILSRKNTRLISIFSSRFYERICWVWSMLCWINSPTVCFL